MSRFAGTGTLLALALRRDRFLLPGWVLTFVLVVGFSGKAVETLYSSAAQVRATGLGWNASPALVALHGRIYDTSSLGAVALVKMTGLGTAMVALFAVLLLVRHTRADEEVGRAELAAAGVVGRYAALAAALLLTGSAVVAVGVLSAASLLLTALPSAGAVAFGLAWAGAGLAFAAIGAVAAQLATSARTARGLGAGAIGALYLVRAIGDTSPAHGHRWVSWLSPLGWAQQVRPYAGDRLWVVLLPLVFAVAVTGVAFALLRGRDLGAGLLADHAGPAAAEPGLRSTLALVWRLDRLALAGWSAGLVVLGVVVGSITSTIGAMLDNPDLADVITTLGGVSFLEDAYLSTALGLLAIAASSYGISAALRLQHEESSGRAEHLLAEPVGRLRWALAHLLPALGGTVVLMVLSGLGVGIAYAVVVGDATQVPRVLAAALARLPAIWVFTAVVVALYGLGSRLAPLGWLVLTALVVLAEFGPLMDLPDWTQRLTPFHYVPSLPGGSLAGESGWAGLAGLVVLAAALGAAGLVAFGRRDLSTG